MVLANQRDGFESESHAFKYRASGTNGTINFDVPRGGETQRGGEGKVTSGESTCVPSRGVCAERIWALRALTLLPGSGWRRVDRRGGRETASGLVNTGRPEVCSVEDEGPSAFVESRLQEARPS